MKIGKFVVNSDGVVAESVEPTSYGTWEDAKTAAANLQDDSSDDITVVGIFIAIELSPTEYKIRSILS